MPTISQQLPSASWRRCSHSGVPRGTQRLPTGAKGWAWTQSKCLLCQPVCAFYIVHSQVNHNQVQGQEPWGSRNPKGTAHSPALIPVPSSRGLRLPVQAMDRAPRSGFLEQRRGFRSIYLTPAALHWSLFPEICPTAHHNSIPPACVPLVLRCRMG